MDGSVVHLGLDMVDRRPRRDVGPARRLLTLEAPDVLRGLGDEGAKLLERIAGVRIGREGVLVSGPLIVFDAIEREGHQGLRFEGG